MVKRFCSIKGCERWAQVGSKCKAHAHGTTPRVTKRTAPTQAIAEPVEVPQIQEIRQETRQETVQAEPIVEQLESQKTVLVDAKSVRSAQIVINLVDVIDQAWNERRSKFLEQISKTTDPFTQMKQTHEVVTWLRSS